MNHPSFAPRVRRVLALMGVTPDNYTFRMVALGDMGRSTLHVIPAWDAIVHELDTTDECICGPAVTFVDPDTDETLEAVVVLHHGLLL